MKSVFFALALVVVGMVGFVGCDFAATDHGHDDQTAQCMSCHSGDTSIGNKILVATAQYEESGHFQGPRSGPDDSATHLYAHHGSNAMYAGGAAYGSDCSKCHSHQGFIAEYTTGDITGAGGDSQIGCFTCHAPHETGGFSLRIEEAVVLKDGTTEFDLGSGNLCVNCHQARSEVDSISPDTDDTDGDAIPVQLDDDTYLVALSSHAGPHHGPMSDMMMGINAGGTEDYDGVLGADNPHAAGNACVDCHLYQWADEERASMSIGLGGHAFYLQGDVHGSVKDVIATCNTCHNATDNFKVAGFDTAGADGAADAEEDWDGDGTTEDVLEEIDGLKDILLAYFGTGSNFYTPGTVLNGNTDDSDAETTDDAEDYFYVTGGDGNGPVNDGADTPADMTTGIWMVDWEFDAAVIHQDQVAAFWTFKYFIEDKSAGIHNPRFAAQMLWDAADSLGETVGTRPAVY
jgi:hypothetical protein